MTECSVPEFRVDAMYGLLSDWFASTEAEKLWCTSRYGGHLRALRGNHPWGWPLVPHAWCSTERKCLYFARDYTGAVKVGVSFSPDRRMWELGGGARLLVLIWPCTRVHEQAIHRLLEPDNTTGEWFQGDLVESLVSFLLAAASKERAA
jgi:hypothetical protein